MGNPAREDSNPGRKNHKRGSVNNKNRLDKFRARIGKHTADWGGCDPTRLQAVVVEITTLGGAVTFGLSRDGGAYSVTIMLDGERETLWFNGGAVLEDELDNISGMIAAME